MGPVPPSISAKLWENAAASIIGPARLSSDIANLPRGFGHSADTRILQLAIRGTKYLILLVGAQGLEPWTR